MRAVARDSAGQAAPASSPSSPPFGGHHVCKLMKSSPDALPNYTTAGEAAPAGSPSHPRQLLDQPLGSHMLCKSNEILIKWSPRVHLSWAAPASSSPSFWAVAWRALGKPFGMQTDEILTTWAPKLHVTLTSSARRRINIRTCLS